MKCRRRNHRALLRRLVLTQLLLVLLLCSCDESSKGASERRSSSGKLIGKEIDTRKALLRQTGVVGARLYAAKFTPDGKCLLATTAFGGGLEAYDASTLKYLFMVSGAGGGMLDVSADSSIAVSTGGVVDLREQKEIRLLPCPEIDMLAQTLSPDGRYYAVSGWTKRAPMTGKVFVWNVESGERVKTISFEGDQGVNSGALRFSPDGSLLAGGMTGMNAVFLWETKNYELVKRLEHPVDGRTFFPFWPGDGQKLIAIGLSGRGTFDTIIDVWDVKEAKLISRTATDTRGLVPAAISPNGKYYVCATWYLEYEGALHIIKVESGKQIGIVLYHKNSIADGNGCSFSSDGKLLAIAEKRRSLLCIWDFEEILRQCGEPIGEEPEPPK